MLAGARRAGVMARRIQASPLWAKFGRIIWLIILWLLSFLFFKLWRGLFRLIRNGPGNIHGTPIRKRPNPHTPQPTAPRAPATQPAWPALSPALVGTVETTGGTVSAATSARVRKILELSEEIKATALGYDEPAMMTVLADLQALPEALEQIASSWRVLAEKAAGEWAAHRAIADLISGVSGQVRAAAAGAAEIGPTLSALHVRDIEKQDDPKQKMWDVTVNQQVL